MPPDIYALCMTRNEADIIAFCLRHAARFCRRIFVLDNGSSDGTWRQVNTLARDIDAVVPFERKACRYGVGLRGYIFNRVRHRFRDGDWILLLDSDEFLEKDPRSTIHRCDRCGIDIIFTLQAQFYVTLQDIDAAWYQGLFRPIERFDQLPAHYLINWREPRLFRYHHRLAWPDIGDDGHPTQVTYPTGLKKRLTRGVVNRHYQFRSRPQMAERLRLRATVHHLTGRFKHSRETDVERCLRNHRRLKKARIGRPITAGPMDYLRLYLIKQSRGFRRYVEQRTLAGS